MASEAGDNPAIMLIPLTQGKFAQVDAHNYEWLMQYRWHAAKARRTFYARRSRGRKQNAQGMHHMVLEKKLGRALLPGEMPDHRNNDGLCNLEKNLRVADHQGNMQNRQVKKGHKYKGVTIQRGEHAASIRLDGSSRPIGRYETAELAAKAYDAAARYYFGQYAWTNFEGDEAYSLEELRAQCKQMNLERRAEKTRGRTSPYIGVLFNPRSGRYISRFIYKGKVVHVGTFDTDVEAAKARDRRFKEYVGPLASPLNFPEDFG